MDWTLTSSLSSPVSKLWIGMSTTRRRSDSSSSGGGGGGTLKLLLCIVRCLRLFTIDGRPPGLLLANAVHARARIDVVVNGPIGALPPICQGSRNFFK
jgi:hypothetical protein